MTLRAVPVVVALLAFLALAAATSPPVAHAGETVCRMPAPFAGQLSWPGRKQPVTCRGAVHAVLNWALRQKRITLGWACWQNRKRDPICRGPGRARIRMITLTM